MKSWKLLGAVTVAVALTAGACANAPSRDAPRDGGTSAGGIQHPTGPGQLVLRIDVGGGFVMPETTLTQIPPFSLYGDGLAVSPGPQIAIYPGPALPAVVQERLSADAVQAILVAARDAGLFQDRDLTDLGSTGIADAGTTTFTVAAEGRVFTTRVYALAELGARPDGMSPDEFQARQDLIAFQAKVTGLGWLPAGSVSDQRPYQAAGLRLLTSEYRPQDGLQESPLAWPLTPGLGEFGQPFPGAIAGLRCGVVAGSDLGTLLPLVERANQLTPWSSQGARFGLLARPLLPDESGC